jgi:hypothetical protein
LFFFLLADVVLGSVAKQHGWRRIANASAATGADA